MTFKQVKAYIKEHGRLTTTYYPFRNELMEFHTCISRTWAGDSSYKNKYDYPVEDNDTVTYQGCLYVEFSVVKDILQATMTVYDGDSFNGMRTSKRCVLVFEIRSSFTRLKELVSERMDEEAEDIIRKEDDEILRKRLHNAKLSILERLK